MCAKQSVVNPVVVIGLGNPLMSDEGVGVRVVQDLEKHRGGLPGVEFVDAGTSGMKALHAMAGRRKAVIVDCARMGEAPGWVRRFRPEDAASRKRLPHLSLHEGDLMDMIELSRSLGECPREVVIIGIEPKSLEPGQGLSPVLESRTGDYLDVVLGELGSGV